VYVAVPTTSKYVMWRNVPYTSTEMGHKEKERKMLKFLLRLLLGGIACLPLLYYYTPETTFIYAANALSVVSTIIICGILFGNRGRRS